MFMYTLSWMHIHIGEILYTNSNLFFIYIRNLSSGDYINISYH